MRARALFGPGPTTLRTHVWPRPGGSCRCTKVWALWYPLLVHGQSQPHLRRGLAGAVGGKIQDNEDGVQASNLGAEDKLSPRQEGPGKILAGTTCEALTRTPPLRLRASDTINNIKTKTQGHMRGGMQIFVKTRERISQQGSYWGRPRDPGKAHTRQGSTALPSSRHSNKPANLASTCVAACRSL
jgi:hypothetical protein